MALEDYLEKPTDPNAPKVFDLQKAQRLLVAAEKYGRLPNGDFVKEMAEQLRLALADTNSAGARVTNALAEATVQQRAAETAKVDLRNALAELANARDEIARLKKPAPPAAAAKKTKRGKNAPIVPMDPQRQATS
jgi:hypothetical protein